MAKPPSMNADQMGAVIDALATTNVLMFTVLASREESDVVLGLLEKMQASFDAGGSLDQLRGTVIYATLKALRGMQAIREGSDPVGGAVGH